MSKMIDKTGKRYGRLTVLNRFDDYISPNGRTVVRWNCKCDCGSIVKVRTDSLKSGLTLSCGCYNLENVSKRNFKDLSGKRFGKLVAIKVDHKTKRNEFIWLCKCDCGKYKKTQSSYLLRGASISCGCSSESFIATELKKYFCNFHNAISEYRLVKSPETNYWLRNDIYIPENIYVEVHGIQHYKYKPFFHKSKSEFEHRQFIDKYKENYIIRMGGIYIEVDLRKIKSVDEAIEYVESFL